MQPASTIATWQTVLRAAAQLRFTRVVPFGRELWFCEFAAVPGRLCRDIVLDSETEQVRTVEDCDV